MVKKSAKNKTLISPVAVLHCYDFLYFSPVDLPVSVTMSVSPASMWQCLVQSLLVKTVINTVKSSD